MELIGLDRAELRSLCERLGHSSFRGDQIADWLYKKGARCVEAMTNIPGPLRKQLADAVSVPSLEVRERVRAADGTTRFLMGLRDGETIESVLLPYQDRVSACVSSQVGCPMGCAFCATADCGFVRNLLPGEIVDQVLTMQHECGRRISNVVFMGMGEPLLNFENVMQSVGILNSEVGIGMRRMTISTVGIPLMIRRLTAMDLQLTLAVSLHAPDDALRRRLMPAADRYPISELMDACREYAVTTRRRITFEYLLVADLNDSPDQARRLAALLRGILANVNLIPYNQVAGKTFRRPSRVKSAAFRQILQNEGVEVSQRMERGHSVAAACGQLKRRRDRL